MFAFKLLLKEQFKPSYGPIALGVFLISLERKHKHRSLGLEPRGTEHRVDSPRRDWDAWEHPPQPTRQERSSSLGCPAGVSPDAPAPMSFLMHKPLQLLPPQLHGPQFSEGGTEEEEGQVASSTGSDTQWPVTPKQMAAEVSQTLRGVLVF